MKVSGPSGYLLLYTVMWLCNGLLSFDIEQSNDPCFFSSDALFEIGSKRGLSPINNDDSSHVKYLMFLREMSQKKVQFSYIHQHEFGQIMSLEIRGEALRSCNVETGTVLVIHIDEWEKMIGTVKSKTETFHVIKEVSRISGNCLRLTILNVKPNPEIKRLVDIIYTSKPTSNVQKDEVSTEQEISTVSVFRGIDLGLPDIILRNCKLYFEGLSFKTVCSSTFTGELFSSSSDVADFVTNATGSFNTSVNFFGTGRYDVTNDLLYFELSFSAELSASISCVEACSNKGAGVGIIRLRDFHKTLQSLDGSYKVPELDSFRITTQLDMPWDVDFEADGNTSIQFKQKLVFNVTAPGKPFIVRMPIPEGSLKSERWPATNGSYRGDFRATPVLKARFWRNSFVMNLHSSLLAGIRMGSRGAEIPRESPALETEEDNACPSNTELSGVFSPFVRNLSGILNAAHNIGWDNVDVFVQNPATVESLTICQPS